MTANWIGASDPSRREAFERALDVAGAGTVLLQTFINRTVQTLREVVHTQYFLALVQIK